MISPLSSVSLSINWVYTCLVHWAVVSIKSIIFINLLEQKLIYRSPINNSYYSNRLIKQEKTSAVGSSSKNNFTRSGVETTGR